MTRANKISLTIKEDETIIALCTPRGSGAIAVLRICGVDSIKVVNEIAKLSSNKQLIDCDTHTIHHGHIIQKEKTNLIIDEVLFFLMHSPKTFTGQNTVEISCHNNPFIIEKIIELAIKFGARLADRGEFTKRAFLNNKVDLSQAESINEIINAHTELALKKSMAQLQGSLSNYLSLIEHDFVELLAFVESSFEFLEEEQQDLNIENLIKNKIGFIRNKLRDAKLNFAQQQQIKDGIRVGIIGWVNAGKSTLFNALLKKDRAIVTNVEGTTRDSIECSIYRNGNFWMLVDTAGLRKTEDFIEQAGIDRSLIQAEQSDIVLLVFDSSINLNDSQFNFYKEIFKKYQNKIILIANKSDIANKDLSDECDFLNNQNIIKVSANKKESLKLLEEKIEEKVQEIFLKLQSPFILNQRQYNLIVDLEDKLEFVVNNHLNLIQYELMAYHIKEMLEKLSGLTGKNVTEQMLDKVFADFCVGK